MANLILVPNIHIMIAENPKPFMFFTTGLDFIISATQNFEISGLSLARPQFSDSVRVGHIERLKNPCKKNISMRIQENVKMFMTKSMHFFENSS